MGRVPAWGGAELAALCRAGSRAQPYHAEPSAALCVNLANCPPRIRSPRHHQGPKALSRGDMMRRTAKLLKSKEHAVRLAQIYRCGSDPFT